MGLKLIVSREDKIVLSNGVVIDILTTSNKQTTLEFTAPKEVKIHAIFKDSSKQFKNLRKNAAALQRSVDSVQPTPEEQRAAKERELRGN